MILKINFENNGEKKISISSIKNGLRIYLNTWKLSPKLHQSIEDVEKWHLVWKKSNKGCVVLVLGHRIGKLYVSWSEQVKNKEQKNTYHWNWKEKIMI